MGRKVKINKTFGRGLGRHRRKMREKHIGRPIYKLKRSKKSKNDSLKLTERFTGFTIPYSYTETNQQHQFMHPLQLVVT